MATQVQWRGGSTAEHATFTGAAREVTVDTQKQTLVVHDGSTAGGEALLREDGSNAAQVVLAPHPEVHRRHQHRHGDTNMAFTPRRRSSSGSN
jgi:hypothetical protein